MNRIQFFSLFLFLSIVDFELFGQSYKHEEPIPWEQYVNVDFKLSIPVSKTNMRPVGIPKEASFIKTALRPNDAYDLISYSGANENFYCTIQVTAFTETVNAEGMSTKLIQLFKSDFEDIEHKQLIEERIMRVGNQRKVLLSYKGEKEYFRIILYVSDRRVISILLSDVSENQQWTQQFLDSFSILY